MLENWSGMDREKAKEYILNCKVCKENALHFGLSRRFPAVTIYLANFVKYVPLNQGVLYVLTNSTLLAVIRWWLWVDSWCRVSW